MLGDTNTDISAIPYHLRYKTDENKHRWILLEEAKTCIASATRELKEKLDSERSNERLKINAVQGHEELLHNLGQCNHEIERLTKIVKQIRSCIFAPPMDVAPDSEECWKREVAKIAIILGDKQ
jgi:hypothetical protein